MSSRHAKELDDDISSISGSGSEEGSSPSESASCSDMVLNNPLYYVLGQFLETPSGKSISTILEDIVQELRQMNDHLATIKKDRKGERV